jgi:aminoglycoside phosphotransferase (APT) family kinase protein
MPNRSNAQPPEYDRTILAIAEYLYHKTPRLKRCHSGCNYCVILTFDDGTADRVLKMANLNDWAVKIERHLYPAMRKHGFPVPEIEFTQEDYPGPPVPFIVMPKFSDHTLNGLCETDPTAALRAFERSGRFIRELDERFAEAFRPFLEERELFGTLKLQQKAINKVVDGVIDLNPVWEKESILAQQIKLHMATLRRTSKKRLAHGVFHTQNILATPGGEICVVDFGESIGMSSPFNDLTTLILGTDTQEQVEAILKGYDRIDEAEIPEYRFWEFYNSVFDMMYHFSPDTDFTQKRIERVRRIMAGQSLLPTL